MSILLFIVIGLVAGLIARAIVPGEQRMGWVMTTVLGMVGSLVGGVVVSLFTKEHFDTFHPTGLIADCWHAAATLVLSKAAESIFFLPHGSYTFLGVSGGIFAVAIPGLILGVGLAANVLVIRFWYRHSSVAWGRVFKAAAALSVSSYVLLMVSVGIWVGIGII